MSEVAIQSLLYAAREGLRRMRELSKLASTDERRQDQHLANLATESDSVGQTISKLGVFVEELPDEIEAVARANDEPVGDPDLLTAVEILVAISSGVATHCEKCGRWKDDGDHGAVEATTMPDDHAKNRAFAAAESHR